MEENEHIDDRDSLELALSRNNKLDLRIEIEKDNVPTKDLKNLSYSVVKLVR